MTIVHFQSTTAVGGAAEYVLTAGISAPGSTQGIGFANGVAIGNFGVLDPSDFKAAKILELYTLVDSSRLVVSMDDETLADNYFNAIEVIGFARVKTVDADFILHSGGLTTWGWENYGQLVNTQVYDVLFSL